MPKLVSGITNVTQAPPIKIVEYANSASGKIPFIVATPGIESTKLVIKGIGAIKYSMPNWIYIL